MPNFAPRETVFSFFRRVASLEGLSTSHEYGDVWGTATAWTWGGELGDHGIIPPPPLLIKKVEIKTKNKGEKVRWR